LGQQKLDVFASQNVVSQYTMVLKMVVAIQKNPDFTLLWGLPKMVQNPGTLVPWALC
jgi:hypothetical protein